MTEKNEVFEKNYHHYLLEIAKTDLKRVAEILGGKMDGETLILPFLGNAYSISAEGISDRSGKRPIYSLCITLSKHVLLCPETVPEPGKWTAYREFKDAGPLIGFFAKDVEQALADHFSGNAEALKKAGEMLGGRSPEEELPYDIALRFDCLPRIAVLLLFNDADEEFPARSLILFQKSIGKYLDMESVAILAKVLADSLKQGISCP